MNTPTHIHDPVSVDVIICGGGPVGLATAYLLGRSGLSVALFERRPNTTTLPKGQYIHASTGELFRQWGVWDLLQDSGWKIHKSNGQGFYVCVANGPVAEIRQSFGSDEEYKKKWELYSPAYPRKVPASEYEAAIRRQAAQWPKVELNFSSRVIKVKNSPDHVLIVAQNTENLRQKTYQARYLVACDGAHSFIRSQVAHGQDHGPTFGNQILVEFRADLDETLGKDGFFHSFVLPTRYAGWFGAKHPETGLWRYSFRHDEEELPPQEVLIQRIRGALGMPAISIEIVEIFRFDYSTGLLRKWREGNIFFAGDAAHWHSPWGGFGMNSGIQDANNLAWKLPLVLKGTATDCLLDTYQTERESKARITVKSATYNSLHYQAIAEATRVGEEAFFAQGTISPEGQLLLTQKMVPHGENAVLHTGYQLGTVYRSNAIIQTHEAPPLPQLGHYTESTLPGVRAPHAWLTDASGKHISTIDLWGQSFVLLAYQASDEWHHIISEVATSLDVSISFVNVNEQGTVRPADGKFATLYGEQNTQLLVRPDGFIAARLNAYSAHSLKTELAQAMLQILGKLTVQANSDTTTQALG